MKMKSTAMVVTVKTLTPDQSLLGLLILEQLKDHQKKTVKDVVELYMTLKRCKQKAVSFTEAVFPVKDVRNLCCPQTSMREIVRYTVQSAMPQDLDIEEQNLLDQAIQGQSKPCQENHPVLIVDTRSLKQRRFRSGMDVITNPAINVINASVLLTPQLLTQAIME